MCLPAHDGFLGYSDLQCVQLLPLLLRFAYLLLAHVNQVYVNQAARQAFQLLLLLLRMLHATAVPHDEDFAPHASERTLFHMPQRGLCSICLREVQTYNATLHNPATGTTAHAYILG